MFLLENLEQNNSKQSGFGRRKKRQRRSSSQSDSWNRTGFTSNRTQVTQLGTYFLENSVGLDGLVRSAQPGTPASLRSEAEKAAPSRKALDKFIQNSVISRFRSHREVPQAQFAVLVFSPMEFSNISQTNIRAAQEEGSARWVYTSSTAVCFPAIQSFTNFVVARKYGPRHSEELIFDYGDLEDLCRKCVQQPIKTLLLYSWLMPCSKCTSRIISEKNKLNGGRRMVVVYTADWVEERNNERNRECLRCNGVFVRRVKYNVPDDTFF